MDEIKRRLTRIEAQLSGQSLLTRLIVTAPLTVLATGLMTGIVLQHLLSTHCHTAHPTAFLWPWTVLLGCGIGIVCLVFFRVRGTPPARVLAGGTWLCFLALGAVRLIVYQTPPSNDLRNLVGEQRTLATVRGRVLTRPIRQQQDWCFARFIFTDPTAAFYLRIKGVETERGWRSADGTIRVQVDEPTPNVQIGNMIEIYCWLYRFEPPTNPGQFDLAGYLARRNVYFGAAVPSRTSVTILSEAPPGIFRGVRQSLSRWVIYALLADHVASSRSEGLLEALLLGSRQNIDRQTYEAFRKTGLSHMISLSGLHLGIFISLIWKLCKAAGLLKRGRALVCIVATAAFLMVVPPRAPTVRAAVIVWTFCAAVLLRRYTNPLNTLCLAALALLLIRPTQLFEAGWQLSFACVAGILAFADFTEDVIRNWVSRRFRGKNRFFSLLGGITRAMAPGTMRLFSMGVAAWIGGAGILLYHFYTVTPLTGFWTVLAFPLVMVILTLGFLKIVLFFLLPTLSYLLGLLVAASGDLLIYVVRILAKPDINCILIGQVGLGVILWYYGIVLLARFGPSRRARLKSWLCIAASLALVLHIGILKWQRTHRKDLTMTCLDVGHGQAILAQLPGTQNILFDAGSMYQHDVGSRIVVPFLDYLGIGHLDAIAISHGDIDHINGIPEIVDRRQVDRVYANEAFFSRTEADGPPRVLADYLNQHGHTIEPIPETVARGDAAVETLWPLDESARQETLSDNDRSIVTQIQFGAARILLCSDIEQFAQKEIMTLYPDLSARLVVAPHHGSTATRDDAFLPHLCPEVVIVSGRLRPGYAQLPITAALEPEYFCTAQNGAIAVCVENNGVLETVPYIRAEYGETGE